LFFDNLSGGQDELSCAYQSIILCSAPFLRFFGGSRLGDVFHTIPHPQPRTLNAAVGENLEAGNRPEDQSNHTNKQGNKPVTRHNFQISLRDSIFDLVYFLVMESAFIAGCGVTLESLKTVICASKTYGFESPKLSLH